ncbi:MAG: cytochrome c biogenesis protein ResB [Deltaproteobacteria bacterium]|nr:cytochrome c biogenesis protein ResB [Deltaproteobacteria bacterium]
MQKASYGRSALWCALAAAVALALQHGLLCASAGESATRRVLVGAAGAGTVLAIVAARGRLRRQGDVLVSTPFVVTVLSSLTLATMLGTVVPQRAAAAAFGRIFGTASGALRALFLDDLFHSLWFSALVLLACMSLGVTALRRVAWTWQRLGHAAAHLGVVLVAAGALVGQFGGVRGRIDLEVGEAADRALVDDWRAGTRRETRLPFAVRLDDFRLEANAPVYRVYVFERTGTGERGDDFRPKLAIAPEAQRGEVVAVDERHGVRVDAYSGGAGAPAPERHVLQVGALTQRVEPHQSYANLAGRHVSVGDYLPHFTYDLETKQPRSLSDRPENPALHVEIRQGGEQGEVEYQGWLFANMPDFAASHGSEHAAGTVPVYRHEGGTSGGPSARLVVLEAGQEVAQGELGTGPGEHALPFADGRYVAVLRLRDTEAKNYTSTLSILDAGQVVARREIAVGDPLSFGGYALYQSNYDPENLRYSGIEVVRDPGLWLVYLGLGAMLLGVVQRLYLRALGRRRVKAEVAA